MNDSVEFFPKYYNEILADTKETGFNQLSDAKLGSLLATLSATKPGGFFLELGTGSGLSTSWLLQGMDNNSNLISVDEDQQLVSIAKKYLEPDRRVKFIVSNGEEVVLNTKPNSVDFIFADTWPGKYNYLVETLSLLKKGGIYIIDDMSPQENWPDGHDQKAENLINLLEKRDDFFITKVNWSTGIIICTKNAQKLN